MDACASNSFPVPTPEEEDRKGAGAARRAKVTLCWNAGPPRADPQTCTALARGVLRPLCGRDAVGGREDDQTADPVLLAITQALRRRR